MSYRGNYGRNFGSGMNYGRQQMPKAKMTQPLTQEQIDALRKKKGGAFTLDIPEIEFTRAKCTHKENGGITLVENSDATVTCTICQETFNLVDVTPEQAEDITNRFLDLFQSIKTYYLDAPDVYISAIADIAPIIKQMPGLYRLAQNNFNRNENGFNALNNRSGMNSFNLLNNLLSPDEYEPGRRRGYGRYDDRYYDDRGYDDRYYDDRRYDDRRYEDDRRGYGDRRSNGFGYNSQSTVVENRDNHTSVQGGNGQTYTKENSVPTKPVTTEKVFGR